jgi:hypothetical protein
MPLPADTDATTPKYLRDKYAIVGVGETTYTRGSGKTARWAPLPCRPPLDADEKPTSTACCPTRKRSRHRRSCDDLGIRLNFFLDVNGGGSCPPRP